MFQSSVIRGAGNVDKLSENQASRTRLMSIQLLINCEISELSFSDFHKDSVGENHNM